MQFNGLLSDSEVKNPNPVFERPVVDDLPGVPKVSGGVLAIYQRALDDNFTMRLIGEASYVGRAALSFDSTLPPRMGRYLRARLAAELATETWRASLFVANPFDNDGDTFAYGNPFTFGEVQQSTPQRPRTFGVRVAAAF